MNPILSFVDVTGSPAYRLMRFTTIRHREMNGFVVRLIGGCHAHRPRARDDEPMIGRTDLAIDLRRHQELKRLFTCRLKNHGSLYEAEPVVAVCCWVHCHFQEDRFTL
jgi:hypothetical protein